MNTLSSIETGRFGRIEFLPEDVITFTEGVIGFPDAKRFLILQHKEGSPFRWLQSLEEPALAFLVVDPDAYVQDYGVTITDELASELKLSDDSIRLIYTIVTIPKGRPQDMSINLAGPIIVNLENRAAVQVVVEDPNYKIKHYVCDRNATNAERTAA